MRVVLDTNILVSAAWSPGRTAARVLESVFAGVHTACYDGRILAEYDRVLHYPKLKFTQWEISAILEPLVKGGLSVVPPPIPEVPFERDETDRKFYEVTKFCQALLVTGNLAHFPREEDILSPADFCLKYL